MFLGNRTSATPDTKTTKNPTLLDVVKTYVEMYSSSNAAAQEFWLEKSFSMGINRMSLAVWLGEDRRCSVAVVGLDFVFGIICGTAVFIESVF